MLLLSKGIRYTLACIYKVSYQLFLFLHFLRKTFHKDKSRKTGIKGIMSNANSKNITVSHHLLNTGTSI